MIDVQADEYLDLQLDSGNDARQITGAAARKQALRLAIIAYFDEIIGEIDRPTALQKIELQAYRVATLLDFVGQVAAVRVEYADDEPDSVIVELVFTDGETDAITLN